MMLTANEIPLPGLAEQFLFLQKHFKFEGGKRVLIIGFGCEKIAAEISKNYDAEVDVIVEDYELFINARLNLENETNVKIKTMDFESVDYDDETFDLIYSQGAISVPHRNKIIKEIKRILKPDGRFSVGEFALFKENPPAFIRDVFEISSMEPLRSEELKPYYEKRNFDIANEKDLSHTLGEYYRIQKERLKKNIVSLSESEKSFYKTALKKISHESNVYLKLGGNKFYGFQTLLLKKKN
ncbi:MAG: methyltransferase domain-containing protein [Chlorobi bacterium]|nr:methyltransferase domain-containing protein [Chlorobiota bacterium]